ncbi:MAG: DUF4259 domain-containing protein [Chthonomonadales bacterium]
MGTWGLAPFENDDALDWLYTLETAANTRVIEQALNAVIEGSDSYLEANDCHKALAAAEIVAAMKDQPADVFPIEASTWVKHHTSSTADELILIAESAIDHIRTKSELRELVEESHELSEWNIVLDDLLSRLRA